MAEVNARADLKTLTGRIVIKVSSSVLIDEHGRIDPRAIRRTANDIAKLIEVRRWPIVVSSGAIPLGMGILGLTNRPRTMAGLQAASAVGQAKLVEAWAQAFRKHEITVAQALITHADLVDPKRFLNARRALGELEKRNVITIINENDMVAFEEIAFGDNDELSGRVANLVDAQLLIMLSDTPGIVNRNGVLLPEALSSDALLDKIAQGRTSRVGSGGMVTKIRAARIASSRGAYVAVADGRLPKVIERIVSGAELGTVLLPDTARDKLKSRAQWISHVLKPAGVIVVDNQTADALRYSSKGLMPSGVTRIVGEFAEGDAVDIAWATGKQRHAFARGLSRYSSDQVRQLLGESSGSITRILGFGASDAVVHQDDLVLLDTE